MYAIMYNVMKSPARLQALFISIEKIASFDSEALPY